MSDIKLEVGIRDIRIPRDDVRIWTIDMDSAEWDAMDRETRERTLADLTLLALDDHDKCRIHHYVKELSKSMDRFLGEDDDA